MRGRVGALIAIVAVLAVATGCGDDDTNPQSDAPPGEEQEPDSPDPTGEHEQPDPVEGTDPETVPTFTSAEVCDALPAERVAAALGVPVEIADPGGSGTPQCSYGFTTPDGTGTNIVVAVMRPVEDLGANAGRAGYEFAVDINTGFAGDTAVIEEVASIGDGATWLLENLGLLVAYQGEQVVTVSGSTLTQEQGGALAQMILSAVT